MAISFDGDEIVFSSGKRVYCHNGVFGLSPEEGDGDDTVSYGGDGGLDVGKAAYHDLSPAEAVELADAMIARWQAFRATWSS